MTLSDIAEKIIRDHLNLDADLITLHPHVTFGELRADSLDVVEIAIAIEMETGIGNAADFADHWGYDTTMAQVIADVEAEAVKRRVAA